MRDFIITSLQTWDIEIGSTIKNTALEISKQNRVLYINTPMDISIRLRGNRQSPSYIRRMAVIKGDQFFNSSSVKSVKYNFITSYATS